MGLILEPDGSYVVLSDILGAEDALGDMDFKVGGSRLQQQGSSISSITCISASAAHPCRS